MSPLRLGIKSGREGGGGERYIPEGGEESKGDCKGGGGGNERRQKGGMHPVIAESLSYLTIFCISADIQVR
jgi:hypothetical protein